MKKFKELLESPVAVIGDWDGFKDKKSTHIAWTAFYKNIYKIIGETTYKGKTVKIAQKDNMFFMGDFGKEYIGLPNERKVFVSLIQAEIIKRKDIKDNFEYKNPIQIQKIEVTNEKLQGVALAFYKYFLSEGYTIISGMVQFDGARKIYSRLSKDYRIKADVIDDSEYITLKKNTDIFHGKDDWDFDENIWSYDFKKSNIKIALIKI